MFHLSSLFIALLCACLSDFQNTRFQSFRCFHHCGLAVRLPFLALAIIILMWYHPKESNSHSQVRSLVYYSLYEGGIKLSRCVFLDLCATVTLILRSRTVPLVWILICRIHLLEKWQGVRGSNPVTYGQSVVSAPIDLPPTKMVLPPGIEPGSCALQAPAMTTSAKAALN